MCGLLNDVTTGKAFQTALRNIKKNHYSAMWIYENENGKQYRMLTGTELDEITTFGRYNMADVPIIDNCKTFLNAVVDGDIFPLAEYTKGMIPIINMPNCMSLS